MNTWIQSWERWAGDKLIGLTPGTASFLHKVEWPELYEKGLAAYKLYGVPIDRLLLKLPAALDLKSMPGDGLPITISETMLTARKFMTCISVETAPHILYDCTGVVLDIRCKPDSDQVVASLLLAQLTSADQTQSPWWSRDYNAYQPVKISWRTR